MPLLAPFAQRLAFYISTRAECEHEIARYDALIHADPDSTLLAALRRFWARWAYLTQVKIEREENNDD